MRRPSRGGWPRRRAGTPRPGFPAASRWLPSRDGAGARSSSPAEEQFEPTLVTQIDIAVPPGILPALDPVTGKAYRRAVVLVRRDDAPIGVVELPLGPDGLSPGEYAHEIEDTLGIAVPATPPEHLASSNGRGEAPEPAEVREQPAIAVVIATRDRAESLARCLSSFARPGASPRRDHRGGQHERGRETEALLERLRAEDPRFRYVREDRPGLAHAHNCGLELVTAPYVAFTDDDVVVDPSWLGGLVEGFGRDERVGCVTGMIFPLELETAAQDWLEHYAGFNKGYEPRVFDLMRPSADPLFPYTAGTLGSGANMAFRTDVLRSMRGFDPALGAGTEAKGGDDLAAFFDVIAAGHALAYEPAAIVYHQHHRTFEALHRQTFGYGAGLTAYLTKTIVDEPRRTFDMLARAPRAAHHALSRSSAKNTRLPVSTPSTLVRQERLGMLVGPALYLLSRWDTRTRPATRSGRRKGRSTRGRRDLGGRSGRARAERGERGAVSRRSILPVLLYHSVAPGPRPEQYGWITAPEVFGDHMAYLQDEGYRTITVSEYAAMLVEPMVEAPERTVVITFDNGFADFAEYTMPALTRYEFRSTVYVVTGCVGSTSTWLDAIGEGDRLMMSWSDIESIAGSGVEIGAQTHSHPQLDIISRDLAWEEIRRSRGVLEDRLGREIPSFAYPFGFHGPRCARSWNAAGSGRHVRSRTP